MCKDRQNNLIPGNGINILRHLNEVMAQIQILAATDCRDSADVLQRCEEELMGITIDVASVCCPGENWDQISELLKSVGINVPEELDKAIRETD